MIKRVATGGTLGVCRCMSTVRSEAVDLFTTAKGEQPGSYFWLGLPFGEFSPFQHFGGMTELKSLPDHEGRRCNHRPVDHGLDRHLGVRSHARCVHTYRHLLRLLRRQRK